MKKPIQQVLLGAIVLAATVTTSTAAISVTTTPTTWSWTSLPGKGDWLSYTGVGTEGTIADQAALNAAVNSIDHAAALEGDINTSPMTGTTGSGGSVGNNWFTDAAKGRYNTADSLFQFAMGTPVTNAGNLDSAYSFLQARARNTSGSPLTHLAISFDLSMFAPGGSSIGPIDGVSVYYSLDNGGAAGTWAPVPGWQLLNTTADVSLGQSQTFSTVLDISATPEAASSDFYIRWAVDNVSGDDIQYKIDNHSFQAVPEPSTGLLAASAAAALGFIRRRRK